MPASSDKQSHPQQQHEGRLYAPLFSLLAPLEDGSGVNCIDSRAGNAHVGSQTTRRDVPFSRVQHHGANTNASSSCYSTNPPAFTDRLDDGAEKSARETSALLEDNREEELDRAAPTSGRTAATTGANVRRATFSQRVAALFSELKRDYEREMPPERVPQRFTLAQRQRMQRYESVDAYEPENTIFKDYLETRSREPRWFIWCFVLGLGLATSAVAVLVVNLLHVLQRLRFESLLFGLRGARVEEGAAFPLSEVLTGQSQPLEPAAGAQGAASLLGGYGFLLLFSLGSASLASLVAAAHPESVGAGTPEVLAYFNGINYFSVLSSARTLFAKTLLVVFTTASGACGAGHYGPLMLVGAMLGAQALQRRRWVRFQNVHFVECFRNPRDERIVIMIGAAAGLAAVLSVSVGGLLVMMEVVTTVFPTRFALYVFVVCLVSCLSEQMYFSYMNYFGVRDRAAAAAMESDFMNVTTAPVTPHPLQLFSSMAVLFHTELPFGEQVKMNVFLFVPSILIGLVSGWLAAMHIRLGWLALQLRRRLELTWKSKTLVRFSLPVIFTLLCVSIQFALVVVVFGGRQVTDGVHETATAGGARRDNDGCVVLAPSLMATRNATSIGFYGLNSIFCGAPHSGRNNSAFPQQQQGLFHGSPLYASGSSVADEDAPSLPPSPRIHGYASLAFASADSVVQSLLSVRAGDLFSAPVLATFFLVYFVLSAIYTGIALSLDTILPPLVMGGALGRLIGFGVAHIAIASAAIPGASTWADPGVFALIGAGSFFSGTSGFTFSVAAILMETSSDFHHLLPLMIGISVARKTTELLTHDFHAVYLAMRCVPVLNLGKRVHKLVMFDAKHVMSPALHEVVPGAEVASHERVRAAGTATFVGQKQANQPQHARGVHCFHTIVTVRAVVNVMLTTTHNAFPVTSLSDNTYKGLVTRRQLELLLWYIGLGGGGGRRSAGAVGPSHVTFGRCFPTAPSAAAAPPSSALLVTPTYEVLCRRLPDYLFYEGLRRHQHSWLALLPSSPSHAAAPAPSWGSAGRPFAAALSPSTLDATLDLSPYVDPSALAVLDSTTLPRAYELFTTLGMRHLVVVDEANHVVGMVTRKDLVADNIVRRTRLVNYARNVERAERRSGHRPLVDSLRSCEEGCAGVLARGKEEVALREAAFLATHPSTMTDRILIPFGTPHDITDAVAYNEGNGSECKDNPLSFMPLHPQPALVAASLRYRRLEERLLHPRERREGRDGSSNATLPPETRHLPHPREDPSAAAQTADTSVLTSDK